MVAALLLGQVGAQDPFLPLTWDAEKGRLLLRIERFDAEFLYTVSIASGLGSNPVGLDRGSLGPQHVVEWRRVGPRVLLVAKNLRYRALTDEPAERLAVTESFAESVLGGFDVVPTDGGAVVVDVTDFALRDAAGAARKVKAAGGGAYTVDPKRSAPYLQRTRSFADNTELEVTLTFESGEPGALVGEAAAARDAFTIRQRHSFVRLPEPWAPRRADPRVGYFGVEFLDYAAPIGAPMHRAWIARHRLEKKDPSLPIDDVVEPIVYYVDPGAPEPVRAALKEGASWWSAAFEVAGFRDAFRVEDLPPDADPLDVRYNVIHWVHRSTRGWSYGASVIDPRTGQILKGSVLLGSLRVRQDHLLFAGLDGPWNACSAADSPGCAHLLPADDARQVELALARIRQLAAHEVGHTLGLSHNFAASSYGRASVMDYPAPWVKVTPEGDLDFSAAYSVGAGGYDAWAIRYGYAQFAPDADESAELSALVAEGLARGYVFLTDQDARAATTFHPRASLWDNGSDPIAELRVAIEVRRIALERFGASSLSPGAPLADLEQALVPLVLHWRYQLEAALKLVGGIDYTHAVNGDGQPGPRAVAAERQLEVVFLALSLLEPATLTLPARIRALIPPPSPVEAPNAERFPRTAGAAMDPVDVALVAADLVLDGLLEPTRAARLTTQGLSVDDRPFGFAELARTCIRATCMAEPATDPTERAVQRAVQALTVDRFMQLAVDGRARADVRSAARGALEVLLAEGIQSGPTRADDAHQDDLHARVRQFLAGISDAPPRRTPGVTVPQGMPIGGR